MVKAILFIMLSNLTIDGHQEIVTVEFDSMTACEIAQKRYKDMHNWAYREEITTGSSSYYVGDQWSTTFCVYKNV